MSQMYSSKLCKQNMTIVSSERGDTVLKGRKVEVEHQPLP